MNPLMPPLPPNFDAAVRDVHAQSVEARIAAARRLGQPDPPQMDEARDGLRELLGDAIAPVRGAALQSLAAVATPDDHARVRAMLDDRDAIVRELAVITLSTIGHPERDEALLAALDHASPEVRFQALAACAQLCPEAGEPHFLQLSQDVDPKVRESAARALAALAKVPGTAQERLLALLGDDMPSVRWEAALSLAAHKHAGALPELLGALDAPDRRLEAVEALEGYPAEAAADRLAALGTAALKPPMLRAAVGRTLLSMGRREQAVEALRRAITAFRSDGRNYAVQTVRKGRVVELAEELARLARRPRGTDPHQLVQALSVLAQDSQAAVDALALLARRNDAVGRAAAAWVPKEPS